MLVHIESVCSCVHVFTFVGLGNLASVTELLSQAEWAVLKSPVCGYAIHHQLHRSLGRLHKATGNLEAALFNFGNDVCVIICTLTKKDFSTLCTF